MKIDVFELGTDRKYIFVGDLTPMQAVNACYEQNRGNFNTWEYYKTLPLVKVTKSGLYCYHGDFTARMQEELEK